MTEEQVNTIRKRKIKSNEKHTNSNIKSNFTTSPSKKEITSTYKKENRKENFFVSCWFACRSIGILYFIFFLSCFYEIQGLLGSNGISPVSEYLSRIAASPETSYHYWFYPTVFWISCTDEILYYICIIGIICSFGIIFDILMTFCSLINWILLLSICTVGQEFYLLHQDLLLLEIGFLFIFLTKPSFNISLRIPLCRIPSNGILWCFRFLLIRILITKAVYQLWGPDDSWLNLSHFTLLFQNQSNPNIISYYAHTWPVFIHQILVPLVISFELIFPLLILTRGIYRKIAGFYIMLLLCFYFLIGNNGTLYYSLFILSYLLLDDSFWVRIPIISWLFFTSKSSKNVNLKKLTRRKKLKKHNLLYIKLWNYSVIIIIIIYLFLSIPPISIISMGNIKLPNTFQLSYKYTRPFRVTNLYIPNRLVSNRKVLIIEASDDAQQWKEYGTIDSPDYRLNKRLPYPSFTLNRLEHALWVAAYSEYEKEIWLSRLLHGILAGGDTIGSLISNEHFSEPPEYIRAILYKYEFDYDSDTNWWKREKSIIFTPSFSQSLQTMSQKRKQFRSRKNKRAVD